MNHLPSKCYTHWIVYIKSVNGYIRTLLARLNECWCVLFNDISLFWWLNYAQFPPFSTLISAYIIKNEVLVGSYSEFSAWL